MVMIRDRESVFLSKSEYGQLLGLIVGANPLPIRYLISLLI